MLVAVLQILAFLNVLPGWLTAILPLVEADAPMAEALLEALVKAVEDIKANPSISHDDAVNTVVKNITNIPNFPFNPAVPR